MYIDIDRATDADRETEQGLSIGLFNRPDRHPFNMLEGMTHAMEAEQTLAWMLAQCVDAGAWLPIHCNGSHGDIESRGLIETVKDAPRWTYRITEKGKGILYAYFGKAVVVQ